MDYASATIAAATALVTTATAIAVAAIAAWVTSKRDYWEKQKVQREIFTGFNKRFDDMNEALHEIRWWASTNTPLTTLYPASSFLNKKGKQKAPLIIIQDYLNLCSEEFLWYKKGLVAEDVWSAWRAGIFYYLRTETFQHHFKRESEFKDSYYGLFAELDRAERGWREPTFLTQRI